MKRIFILLLFVFVYNANSQSLIIFDVDTTDFPTMRAKFYAFDEDGKQITNLSTSDFELTENGEVRTITDISCPTPQPPKKVSVAMSIDVSGSMRGNNFGEIPVELGKITATTLCNSISMPQSEFALQTCDDKALILQDYTTQKTKILNAIKPINAFGGNDFKEHLLNNLTGLLNIARTGKNKRVAVIYTDAWWYALSSNELKSCIDTCNKYDIEFYAVIYSRPESEPNGIKSSLNEICKQTGGFIYDGITSQNAAKDIALRIQNIIQEGIPCKIQWQSGFRCIPGKIVVELKNSPNNLTSKTTYQPPNSSYAKLEFEPNIIRFDNPPIGNTVSKTLKITARNATFIVSNITSSNPAFSISPTNFVLQPNESRDLTISYTAVDSGYTFSRFTFENDICLQTLFTSGGYRGVRPKTPTLKLTHPNGGEKFVIGSDTVITWEGISSSDTVKLDYSIDDGATWQSITNEATGLKYEWKNIPKPISNQCIVKINQLVTSSTFNDNVLTLTGHTGVVESVAFSPDGSTIASGSRDRTVKLWDVNTGQEIRTLNNLPNTTYGGFPNQVNCVAFRPDGSTIASGSRDRTVKLWDVATGQIIRTLTGHNHNVRSVAFSPDGITLASGSNDRTIKLWDVATGQEIRTLVGHSNDILSVGFSPDGSKIASGSYVGTVKIWDVKTGQEIHTLTENYAIIYSTEFSPDGKTLASVSSGKIKLWDVATGQEIITLTGNTGIIYSIEFSPDGKTLASGSSESTIKLWDISTGQEIRTLTGHTDMVESVAFSPDGSTIASGSRDSTIKLWDVDVASLQEDVSDNVFSIVAPEATANDVDMGKLLLNDIKDSVVVEFVSNIGTYPFSVDSIYFQGADAGAFSLVSGFPEYTIEANNSHFAEFRFAPQRVGVHNAEIVVITQSDTFTQNITGEGIDRNITVIQNFIDFGQVYLGDVKDTLQNVTIKNVGSTPFTINETKHNYPNDIDFTTLAGGGNFTLQPNETRPMELRFTPSDIGRTSGMLEFHYDGVGSPAVIQLFGEGIERIAANLKIKTLEFEAYAGDEIEVPIIISEKEFLDISGVESITANLIFNPTLLLPIGYDAIVIDDNTAYIEINDIPVNDEIKTVHFKAGLGNAVECDLIISNPVAIGGEADIAIEDGKFTLLGVCYEGGARLLDPNSVPVILSINPNPTGNTINIEFELIEKGGGELMIVDYEGKKVFSTLLKDTPGKVNLELNSSGLPNGIYNVILQTPTINATQKLLIEK